MLRNTQFLQHMKTVNNQTACELEKPTRLNVIILYELTIINVQSLS